MGPKKDNADLKSDDALVAVVMADSYVSKFGPLAVTKPRVRLFKSIQIMFASVLSPSFSFAVPSTAGEPSDVGLHVGVVEKLGRARGDSLLYGPLRSNQAIHSEFRVEHEMVYQHDDDQHHHQRGLPIFRGRYARLGCQGIAATRLYSRSRRYHHQRQRRVYPGAAQVINMARCLRVPGFF